ncbi:MAG TPA: hypothetical protein VET48_07385, partial [Steroidobacteraceae bacterium]|nr:hypothetical protein [Steroidobacteraceae bacterium]
LAMTRQEKMILTLVILVVVTRIAALGEDMLVARIYGTSNLALEQRENWQLLRFAISSLVNVGAAIWIYVEARALMLKAWIWALLGLFFALTGVIVFYAAQLYLDRLQRVVKASET